MPPNAFSWLHLTDLHFGQKGQVNLWPNLRKPFLDDLEKLYPTCGPWHALLFTGDLVQEGKTEEFKQMQREVLDRLWKKLDQLGSGDAVLLAVPGNHDLSRPDPKEDNPAMDTLLDQDCFKRIAERKFWDKPTGSYRKVINDAFTAYSEWWDSAPHRPKDLKLGILPGDFACTLVREGISVGIVGLNTAFLQLQGGDYQGKLAWDVRQLHAVCDEAVDDWLMKHDICLLLTHQGPDWLTPEARDHGKTEIAPAGRFAAHLFGHMHETNMEYIRYGGSTAAVRQCQACSLFGMEKYGEPPTQIRSHGYVAGRIEFKGEQAYLRLWPRVATKEVGPWRYIPDHHRCVLEPDEGTARETIKKRPDNAGGYAELNKGENKPLGPSVATSKAGPRHYTSAHDSCVLEIDEGTAKETIPIVSPELVSTLSPSSAPADLISSTHTPSSSVSVPTMIQKSAKVDEPVRSKNTVRDAELNKGENKPFKEFLIKSFDKLRTSGKMLIPLVVSLLNHMWNRLILRFFKYSPLVLVIVFFIWFLLYSHPKCTDEDNSQLCNNILLGNQRIALKEWPEAVDLFEQAAILALKCNTFDTRLKNFLDQYQKNKDGIRKNIDSSKDAAEKFQQYIKEPTRGCNR